MAKWNYADNTIQITLGKAGLKYDSVIQRPDSSGGYNANFATTTPGSASYHVHFSRGGTKVKIIRYKPHSASPLGDNIVDCSSFPQTFGELLREASAFPNTKKLIENFKTAVEGLKRTASNELE